MEGEEEGEGGRERGRERGREGGRGGERDSQMRFNNELATTPYIQTSDQTPASYRRLT